MNRPCAPVRADNTTNVNDLVSPFCTINVVNIARSLLPYNQHKSTHCKMGATYAAMTARTPNKEVNSSI